MTLLINVLTAENVIQASDRRLTRLDGSLFDDHANKTVCVFCKDALFAISYTGVAEIAAKRTDLWLIDYLTSIHASKMTVPSISEALEKEATSCLKSINRKYRQTSIVLAGYRLGMPFIALISNCETFETKLSNKAIDRFQTHVKEVRGPIRNTKRGLWVLSFGIVDLEKEKPISRRIRKIARKGFFHKQDASAIADKLVLLIRAASRTPSYGNRVGRNCMTAAISPRGPISTKYHPDMNSPVQYMPHMIIGNDELSVSYKDIELWTEKPPWW